MRMCKDCKASFPSGNKPHCCVKPAETSAIENELKEIKALLAKPPQCKCAAMENELREIKELLAGVLASKSEPEINPDFQVFKELSKSEQESNFDYIGRLEKVFLKLPVRLQYQQETRWQLYEHLRDSIPEYYMKERTQFDKLEVFHIFYKCQREINEQEPILSGERSSWIPAGGGICLSGPRELRFPYKIEQEHRERIQRCQKQREDFRRQKVEYHKQKRECLDMGISPVGYPRFMYKPSE